MGLDVEPRPQPWQVLEHINWSPRACPESCAALQKLALLPGLALCHPSSEAVGGGDGSTSKSLRTEPRLFRNLQTLDAVQAERGKLPYLTGLQRSKFPVQAWEALPPSGQLRMTGPLKMFRPGTSQTDACAHCQAKSLKAKTVYLLLTA